MAAPLLEKAISLDSTYADAYAILAAIKSLISLDVAAIKSLISLEMSVF